MSRFICRIPFGNGTERLFSRFIILGLLFFLLLTLNLSTQAGLQLNGPSWVIPQQLGPNVNYGLIIDAGSSGSRIHIYIWPPHSGDPKELLQIQPLRSELGEPIHYRITPGLSSVSAAPWEATNYMTPLLKFAAAHVPEEKHKETPLYILATAGMRLLEKSDREAILDNLRTDIPRNYSFYFPENNVEIISGKQEGVFQWLAINLVLGKLQPVIDDSQPITTAGIMDMGGASLQIAFQLPRNATFEKDIKSHTVEVNVGSQSDETYFQYHVYVNTFLGFGANEQYNIQRNLLVEKRNKTSVKLKSKVLDNCFPKSYKENITNVVSEKPILTDFQLVGTGDWDGCVSRLAAYLNSKNCSNSTRCFNDGKPLDSLLGLNFYGFSEFWYTMEDVYRVGGSYSLEKIRKAAKHYCSTDWSVLKKRYSDSLYSPATLDRLERQCFKSAWLVAVIHHLFHFPSSYTLLTSTPNDVSGHVVAWTLGALLYKTRYFPLRSIQRGNPHMWFHTVAVSPKMYLSHGLLFICIFVVMTAFIVAMRKISRYHKYGSLRRVPTHEQQFSVYVDNNYLLSETP